MSNFKEKAKKFLKENKDELIVTALLCVTSGVGIYGIAKAMYAKGFIDGGYAGFHLTLDWLDKNFPDRAHANLLWKEYKETHPEKIVYRKGLGKWS